MQAEQFVRPVGDAGAIRSAARQAEVLAGALEQAAGGLKRSTSVAEGWRGAAATIFGWAAEGCGRQVLGAAESFRMTARALSQLAMAVEEAQQRAGRALVSLQMAEEDVQRARLAADRARLTSGGGTSYAPLAAAEEQYLWIRQRAKAECLAAVEAVEAADRTAAVIIEAQAFHAPLPAFRAQPQEPGSGSGEGVGSFLDGAVRGDFSDNDSWSAIGGQVGIGLVPIAGQIADGRDIVAAIKDKAWGRLPLAALGIVPGLDFLKGRKAFSRAGRKVLREVAERGLGRVAEEGLQEVATARRLSEKAVGHLRKQLVEIEVHKVEAVARLDMALGIKGLPNEVRTELQQARNALRDHLKPADLTGALRDGKGLPVSKASGKAYAHAKEVSDSLDSLENARKVLVKRLPDGLRRGWNAEAQQVQDSLVSVRQLRDSVSKVVGVELRQ